MSLFKNNYILDTFYCCLVPFPTLDFKLAYTNTQDFTDIFICAYKLLGLLRLPYNLGCLIQY